MNNIKSEEILTRAHLLDNENPEHSYHKSCFHFINYFAGRNEITEQDLVIGSNFTYGWMPTILKFKSEDFELAVSALNRAKAAARISSADIMVLKGLINNSLVGVSKLLHFINPQVYAIWDSRVCNFPNENSGTNHVPFQSCPDTWMMPVKQLAAKRLTGRGEVTIVLPPRAAASPSPGVTR